MLPGTATLVDQASDVIWALARASLVGTVFIVAVFLIGRLVPRLPPAARCALWWCAALKLIVDLAGVAPIRLPVLPARGEAGLPARVGSRVTSLPLRPGRVLPAEEVAAAAPPSRAPMPARAEPGPPALILAVCWAGGLAAAAALGIRRARRAARVVARSVPAPPEAEEMMAELARRLGLGRPPRLRVSKDVETPLVVGFRPTVLVPAARVSEWSAPEHRMALCHELAHIKRGDLWFGCVPALAERLFFFHPLVHVAAREYALWREAACDAVVMRVLGATPWEYGRLLVGLGVARPGAGLAAAGAPWSFSVLQRRIAMLRDVPSLSSRSRILTGVLVCVAVLSLVALRPVARANTPVVRAGDAPASSASALGAPSAAIAPGPGAAEAAPAPSAARAASDQRDRNQLEFILLTDGQKAVMSGMAEDVARVRKMRTAGEHLLWFRWDDREYLVRDLEWLRQFEEIWRSVSDLGDEQRRAGRWQRDLVEQQAAAGAGLRDLARELVEQQLAAVADHHELARELAEVGRQQGEIARAEAERAARDARQIVRDTERAVREAVRAEIERERLSGDRRDRDIERQVREVERQAQVLASRIEQAVRPAEELGRQMEVLGKEVEAFSRHIDRAAMKAETEMLRLLGKAIAAGVATAIK